MMRHDVQGSADPIDRTRFPVDEWGWRETWYSTDDLGLTETVFAFNGIGRFLRDAIFTLDYPVLQGFIIFIALAYSLINLLVDISYSLIDPRVRVQ